MENKFDIKQGGNAKPVVKVQRFMIKQHNCVDVRMGLHLIHKQVNVIVQILIHMIVKLVNVFVEMEHIITLL